VAAVGDLHAEDHGTQPHVHAAEGEPGSRPAAPGPAAALAGASPPAMDQSVRVHGRALQLRLLACFLLKIVRRIKYFYMRREEDLLYQGKPL